MITADEEDRQLAQASADLQREFPSVSAATVQALCEGIWAAYADARIRTYLPLLMVRQARARLQLVASP